MSIKIPCKNCITLSVCKAMVMDYYEKETHEKIVIFAKLMLKCPEFQIYAESKMYSNENVVCELINL